jgi:hypothetical protein
VIRSDAAVATSCEAETLHIGPDTIQLLLDASHTAGAISAQHERMLEALDAADASMRSFRVDPDATAASTRAAVAHLAGVLIDHLAHEERDLEPISVEHHASPQIRAAQQVVRKAHKGNQGTLFAWLQDGADADAIRGLRNEVPRPVLFVMTRTAGRHYNRRIAPTWA